MKFHIPFTFSPIERLKQQSKLFASQLRIKKQSTLGLQLQSADVDLTREEYLGIIMRTFITVFIILLALASTALYFAGVAQWLFFGPMAAILFSGFIASTQLVYPKVYSSRREKNIEKNLIPALEDMLVQLNSGVPLFSILVNISSSQYGELSIEFKKAIKKINAGVPQTDVLDELGKRNTSLYFRRTVWQISNGMKAGSDIAVVIKESITSLNEEQLLQIQNYGNKLNPLIMFYMLISVILPALAITFLTVIASLVNLSQTAVIGLFAGLFVLVIIIQVTFLGMMKSMRPSLL